VRARKADVDDFAAARLTTEQFGQKSETVLCCRYVPRNGRREFLEQFYSYTGIGR
jgi:hypothetical protein